MSDAASNPQKPPPGRAYEVLTPGEKFGDYQILKCLSYDLMGSLYRVRRARETEEQTIFVLPPLVGNDAQFRERFEQTCNKLKELEQENIFSLRDARVIKQRYTLLSDDFEGQNIADYVESAARKRDSERPLLKSDELLADQSAGLDPEEVKHILKSLAQALKHAHEHDVIHLNLNPTNILRSKDGQIKVIGFGLMTMAGKTLFESLVSAGIPPISLGPRRIRINTVDILSPEVRLGKPGDQRSDIYALGLTTYWLLTGRKPEFDYKPPSHYVDDLESGWDMLVARCLERDPENRYQTATAVLKDLERLGELQAKTVPEESGTRETGNILKHINFIPVPRGIKQRGAVLTRAYRLAVIGIFSVFLTFLISSFYQIAFADSDRGDGPVAMRTPEGRQPRLTINVSPPNASVRFPAEGLNFIIRGGQLDLNVLPGTYRIEVFSPQHITSKKLVEIKSQPQSLDFVLEPDWATVEIETTPGATAEATDKNGVVYPLGQADAEGRLKVAQRLYSGEYTLTLSRTGYHPFVKENFALSGGEDVTTAVFPLKPILGTLRVRSEPRDAQILIDEEVVGATNFTLEDLPVDEQFLVTLRKAGYREKTLAVQLEPNTRTVLDFGQLEQQHGSLSLQLSFNGQPASDSAMEQTQFIVLSDSAWWSEKQVLSGALAVDGVMHIETVPIGDITLRILHPEYITLERKFELPDRAQFRLPLDMLPKPAIITIHPHPEDLPLELVVNGRSRQLGNNMEFAVSPGKSYELTLSAPDFIPVTRTITLRPNERMAWDASLMPIPGPTKGEDYTVPYVEMPLAWIPAGHFTMGSPREEPARLPEEGPLTTVTLSEPFWLGQYEVTQEQYASIMGDNPSNFKGPDKPVESVSWKDAMRFLEKLNAREAKAGRLPSGYEYRLPTEAEWEYAAREAGRSENPFYWGDTASPQNANFKGQYPRDFSSPALDKSDVYGTTPVGSYTPNALGLHDMHGNVREWCLDYFNARLPGEAQRDWLQRNNSQRRVVRGGAWEDFAIHSRAAYRGNGQRESTRSEATGFRVVLGPKINMP